MREAADDYENATGIGAIRVLLLTGFRRMEGLGLCRWVHAKEAGIHFPDTKSDFQVRAIGRSALAAIQDQPGRAGCDYVFPADVGDGHFIGVVRVPQRVCRRAKLTGVTPHTLRHTFASVAGDLGFSELTHRRPARTRTARSHPEPCSFGCRPRRRCGPGFGGDRSRPRRVAARPISTAAGKG